MKKESVGIIVLNWNRSQDTLRCLKSLSVLLSGNVNHVVYVVDNGSTECYPQIYLETFPEIKLIVNEVNHGFAEGNNIGIRHAFADGCDHILLLNNDTIVPPNLVDTLYDSLIASDKTGIVTPKIKFLTKPELIQFAGGEVKLSQGKAVHYGYNNVDNGAYDHVKEVSFSTGACVLLNGKMLKQIGFLNKEYFLYHEDTELSVRASKSGYRQIYNGNVEILHDESPSSGGYMNPTSFYYSTRNSFYLVKEHGECKEKILFFLYIVFYYTWGVTAYSVLKRKPAILKSFCRAVYHFLTGKRGKV